ncbi:MAG: hypothetical protein U5J78_05320 [Parasphingorhabdus sp.]|nr:hypothetical protein [Parasphingorhabdus sp.]
MTTADAGHDVGVQRFAPQIEEAVLQADVLGVRLFIRNRQRQFLSRGLHFDCIGDKFDFAGRQGRVNRFGGSQP